MNLEDLFNRDAFIEGVGRGVKQFLAEIGADKNFAGVASKGVLLTADEAAKFVKLTRRTFDENVAKGVFRKVETLGHSEPRYWSSEIEQDLPSRYMRKLGKAEHEEPVQLTVVDLGARRRRQKAA